MRPGALVTELVLPAVPEALSKGAAGYQTVYFEEVLKLPAEAPPPNHRPVSPS